MREKMRALNSIFSLFLFLALTGCASYQSKMFQTRQAIKMGQTEEALTKLEALSQEEGRDQLLYMLDYATALQISGKYKESSQAFIKADKLVDLKDYHSVSKLVGATLGGEEMVQYKGESYEKFLINTMNAINFLMMGEYDSALVEARVINEKISKMRMDGRDPYELSPFARYLAAILWETQKKYDDAYIEYEGSYKLDSTNPLLPQDLIEMAKKSRRMDSYNKWKKEFPQIKEDPKSFDRSYGELIVIYQQGWGAEKTNRGGEYRFPALRRVSNTTQKVRITVNQKDSKQDSSMVSEMVYNVDQVAMDTLEKDFGALVARRVGGVVAKAVVSDQIRQKNQLLGDLTWIAMNLADRADLRQWSTLPSSFQISRVYLKPGIYKVLLEGLDSSEAASGEVHNQEITVKAGSKSFINWRSLK